MGSQSAIILPCRSCDGFSPSTRFLSFSSLSISKRLAVGCAPASPVRGFGDVKKPIFHGFSQRQKHAAESHYPGSSCYNASRIRGNGSFTSLSSLRTPDVPLLRCRAAASGSLVGEEGAPLGDRAPAARSVAEGHSAVAIGAEASLAAEGRSAMEIGTGSVLTTRAQEDGFDLPGGAEYRAHSEAKASRPSLGPRHLGSWHVREAKFEELRAVANLQADTFYEPPPISALSGFFLDLFKAEVYDSLLQKVKYARDRRFVCLIAVNQTGHNQHLQHEIQKQGSAEEDRGTGGATVHSHQQPAPPPTVPPAPSPPLPSSAPSPPPLSRGAAAARALTGDSAAATKRPSSRASPPVPPPAPSPPSPPAAAGPEILGTLDLSELDEEEVVMQLVELVSRVRVSRKQADDGRRSSARGRGQSLLEQPVGAEQDCPENPPDTSALRPGAGSGQSPAGAKGEQEEDPASPGQAHGRSNDSPSSRKKGAGLPFVANDITSSSPLVDPKEGREEEGEEGQEGGEGEAENRLEEQKEGLEASLDGMEAMEEGDEVDLYSRPYLYVSGMAVGKDHRRSGVASSLLSRVDELAASWGFRFVVLHVHEDNIAARRLYTQAGFLTLNYAKGGWSPQKMFLGGGRRKLLLVKRVPRSVLKSSRQAE